MQRLVWIPLLVVLETFLVGMADAQVQRLRQVEVVTPLRYCLTKDRMFRPTAPSCQPGTLCTSWQDIPESTIGPLSVGRHDTLVVDFAGNYNCDGCIDAVNYPFVQVRLQLATDAAPSRRHRSRAGPRAGTSRIAEWMSSAGGSSLWHPGPTPSACNIALPWTRQIVPCSRACASRRRPCVRSSCSNPERTCACFRLVHRLVCFTRVHPRAYYALYNNDISRGYTRGNRKVKERVDRLFGLPCPIRDVCEH